ncbi:GNAT family N-acetyltransferase [Agarilytica rhodophyticola]|uniref:GNAT family N-acetyltransferase n=1 Tax=Agarilytica rhodophyticola TaxID=1737490 RepID=UPI001C1FF2D9|nr:GNAT family N-acetyltransferase [Agarilytica rhodophyticola]
MSTQDTQLQVINVDFSQPLQRQHLRDMLMSYSADPMGGGEALPQAIAQQSIDLMAEKDFAHGFLCYHQDRPVGFANCFENIATFAAKSAINIHDLGVIPEYRGKGAAQALLQAVEDFARRHDYYKITLEVLEGNERAKGAYTKFGFAGYQLNPELGYAMFWQKLL